MQAAAELAVERGGVVAEPALEPEPVVAADAPSVAGTAMPPERIAALLAEARAAIIASDLDTAIRDYTRLLEEPGEHRAEARENLGLARECSRRVSALPRGLPGGPGGRARAAAVERPRDGRR
jgi:hypothetical protein